VGCHAHEQSITDLLHLSRPNEYKYASASCYSCHTSSSSLGSSHLGIQGGCAQCHDVGAPFAALPVPGFDHPSTGGADCSSCHATSGWKGATGGAPTDARDPAQDVVLDALIPTYTSFSISTLSPETETLPQRMNHATTAVDATVLPAATPVPEPARGVVPRTGPAPASRTARAAPPRRPAWPAINRSAPRRRWLDSITASTVAATVSDVTRRR